MEPLNHTIATAATNAYFSYFIPFLLIGAGIGLFFAFLNRNPQIAAIGCCSFLGLGFLAGLVIIIGEFIKAHAVLCLVIGLILAIGCLITFMVYSPPSPPNVKDDYDPEEDKDNPFYEGPR